MLKFLRRKKTEQLIKKNYEYPAPYFGARDCRYDVFKQYIHDGVSMRGSLQLYSCVSPFYLAVDKIAKAFSEIEFKVKDKSTGEFIDHPVLDLLANPNAGMSAIEFKYQISTFFSVTGNNFMISTGRLNAEPLEIWPVLPYNVTPQKTSKQTPSYVPSNYFVYSSEGRQMNYVADDVDNNGFSTIRYYYQDSAELWHSKHIDPLSDYSFFGLSKATPLFTELQQFAAGNTNNLSLLNRGMRSSVAFVNNRGEELTETQYGRIKEEASKYSGASNAGSTPVLDGMDIKEMSQNNRDMQFKELQDQMKAMIFNVYGIPLALMSESVMTMNNLETSQVQFYDNAVIPQFKYIANELTRFLMYRYPDSENLEITFSPASIEPLRARAINNAGQLNNLNVNTINEIREAVGHQPLSNGGDSIMGPSSQVVVAGNDAPSEKSIKEQFIEKMRAHGYKKDRILELWGNVNREDNGANERTG